jgi:hypothetical protein
MWYFIFRKSAILISAYLLLLFCAFRILHNEVKTSCTSRVAPSSADPSVLVDNSKANVTKQVCVTVNLTQGKHLS